MKCFWVPKRSAQAIRDALKGAGRALEALRPDAKLIDSFQHKLDAEAAKINSRLTSPFEKVVKQGEKDAEASWIRRTHEAVEAGMDPKYIEDRLPKTPKEAAAQAYWYAKQAATRRFQREGWETGLLGPASSPNHVHIPLQDLMQGEGRYLGVLKGMQGRVTQTLSAFERQAPKDALGKVGKAVQGVKHAAVGLQMWTPMFHNMTILGRFLPTLMNARGIGRGLKTALTRPGDIPAETLRAIRDLQKARTDPAEAERLGRLGLIQLGPHGYEGALATKLE